MDESDSDTQSLPDSVDLSLESPFVDIFYAIRRDLSDLGLEDIILDRASVDVFESCPRRACCLVTTHHPALSGQHHCQRLGQWHRKFAPHLQTLYQRHLASTPVTYGSFVKAAYLASSSSDFDDPCIVLP